MNIICFHLNQVGDLIFSLPALKCIRDSFTGCSITSVVRPGARELLECTNLPDHILCRNNGWNLDKYELIRSLSSVRYDLAIVFSQSAECALLAFLSGAPKRVGFINTSLGVLLNQHVGFTHPPSTDNNLRLVAAIGCRITSTDYSGLITPSPEHISRAQSLLASFGISESDDIVVLSPGTSGRRSVKEWSDSGFADVGNYLNGRGVKTVILGTIPATGITDLCSSIIDLSGKTSLAEAAAVLYRSRAVVSVDSGMLHLGAAVGTRVVGLYGPSNHNITGPRGEGHVVIRSDADCSPCMRTECNYKRKCMTDIDSGKVIAAMDNILASGIAR
ncbi:MAG: glycosyltransferase family 9 protein [Armatimonadota bacterium]|nr:glycosyltransferase family 9 protein [bacterium]